MNYNRKITIIIKENSNFIYWKRYQQYLEKFTIMEATYKNIEDWWRIKEESLVELANKTGTLPTLSMFQKI